MESTYGDRNHENHGQHRDATGRRRSAARREAGGNVVIPIFAIERAQELIYYLSRLVRGEADPQRAGLPRQPHGGRRDRDLPPPPRLLRPRDAGSGSSRASSPLGFPGLTIVRSVEQSKAINRQKGPAIIMATYGMCTAGRIKHHLAQYIDRPECTILFVGYQAQGTLGPADPRRQPGGPHPRPHRGWSAPGSSRSTASPATPTATR